MAGRTINGAEGLATDPISGKLYALLRITPAISQNANVRELVTIDLITAVVTDVGPVDNGSGLVISDISFSPDGSLYGVTADSSPTPESLFSLDKANGTAAFFMTLGNGDVGETIAFFPNGLLYHFSGENPSRLSPPPPEMIFEFIDLATRFVRNIPIVGQPSDQVISLTHNTGDFFLAADLFSQSAQFPARLLSISKDGAISVIASLTYRPTGMAFATPPPLQTGPTFPPNSMVNGASFRAATDLNGAVAPGAIVSAFGTSLADATSIAATVPLPTTLGTTSITFNGVLAPLFTTATGQINVQVPWEVGTGAASVQVRKSGQVSTAQNVQIASVSPGIFTVNQQGTGQGAILISNSPIFAAPANSVPGQTSRPAARNEFISIFCTGLGDVTNRPASGNRSSGGGLSVTLTTPTVLIGGVSVNPAFSGLTNFVGLYQVDVQIPANAPSGNAVPVGISMGGVSSNTATIAIQ